MAKHRWEDVISTPRLVDALRTCARIDQVLRWRGREGQQYRPRHLAYSPPVITVPLSTEYATSH